MADAASPVVASAGGPQPVAPAPIQLGPPPNLAQSSAAATNPAFADAGATAANQKQALLTAIAQAGAAGRSQYQALQQQNAQDKQSALQAAAQREAVVQNMPPALAAQLAGMTSQGFDLNSTLLSDTDRTAAQGMGLLSAAGGNYMTELGQAIPLVQADTQSKIAALQEQAYEKGTTASAQAAKAGVQAGGGLSPAEVVKNAGGVQTLAAQLQTGARGYEAQNGGAAGAINTGPNLAGTQFSPHASDLTPQSRDQLDAAYYSSIDKFNHWPDGTAASLANQGITKTNAAAAKLSSAQIAAAHAKVPQQDWSAMLNVVDTLTKKGNASYADLYGALLRGGADPQTAQAVIAAYQTQEPKTQALGGK